MNYINYIKNSILFKINYINKYIGMNNTNLPIASVAPIISRQFPIPIIPVVTIYSEHNQPEHTVISSETTNDTNIPLNQIIMAEIVPEDDIVHIEHRAGTIETAHTIPNRTDHTISCRDICNRIVDTIRSGSITNIIQRLHQYNLFIDHHIENSLQYFLLIREIIIETYIMLLLLNIIYSFINPLIWILLFNLLVNTYVIIRPNKVLFKYGILSNLFKISGIIITNIIITYNLYFFYNISTVNPLTILTILIYIGLLYILSLIMIIYTIYMICGLNKMRLIYKRLTVEQIHMLEGPLILL